MCGVQREEQRGVMADERLHRHAISRAELNRFCWIDLATTDQAAAKSFYGALFGWNVSDQHVREGQFSLFGSAAATSRRSIS